MWTIRLAGVSSSACFKADEISNITIVGGDAPQAELRYCPKTWTLQDVVQRIVGFLRQSQENGEVRSNGRIHGESYGSAAGNGHAFENGYANGNGHANSNGYANHNDRACRNGHVNGNGHANGNGHPEFPFEPQTQRREMRGPSVAKSSTARDSKGIVRYYRHDSVVTGWETTARSARPAAPEESGPLPQVRTLPGHRAGVDEHPGDRSVQDQLD